MCSLQDVEMMQNDTHVYQKIYRSVAPHVFGHEEIKKVRHCLCPVFPLISCLRQCLSLRTCRASC